MFGQLVFKHGYNHLHYIAYLPDNICLLVFSQILIRICDNFEISKMDLM